MPKPSGDDARRPSRRAPKAAIGPRRRALVPGAEALEPRELMARYVAGEVLIQFKPGVADAARAAARGVAEAALGEEIHTGPMRDAGRGVLERVILPAGRPVDVAIRALQNNPNVEFAEPNWIYTRQATSDDPSYTNGSLWGMYGDGTVPANAFGSQAGEAWAADVIGSRSVYVGIIDEGIQYTHPDLAGNVWDNPFDPADGVDNDGNGYADDVQGWDFAGGNNTVYDGTGDDHGTHVAGTIAAKGGNGIGVAGVSWDVTYISAKFLGSTGGSLANAVKAIDYFTDLKVRHGLNIVATNNSWGGGGFSQSLLDAITRAARQNILFVAAAGNGGSDQVGDDNDATASYPSNYDTTAEAGYNAVMAVAAIDRDGNLAGFSNYGATKVHIGAPGVAINSTLPENTYGLYSGTSMATPHVTGAVALYAAKYPTAGASDIRRAILEGAAPTASLSGKTSTGGRLDIPAALGVGVPVEPPASAPTDLVAAADSSSRIALSWSHTGDDESGFKVERSTDGTTFTQIAVVGADATGYLATGLAADTAYSFRVRAYNAAGDSGYSNTAVARTSTAVALPFRDSFTDGALGSPWKYLNGDWSESGGVLVQGSTLGADPSKVVDPKKAIVENLAASPNQITAKVRVLEWKDGEYARAGVGLYTDPVTGAGVNLVFTGKARSGTNKVAFLQDGVRWSGTYNFSWTVGTTYTFKLMAKDGVLYGKIWASNKSEPNRWQFSQSGWLGASPSGAPALNGSSSGPWTDGVTSYARVAFDDVLAEETISTSGGSTKSLGGGMDIAVAGGASAEPLAAPDSEAPRTAPAPAAVDVLLEPDGPLLMAGQEVVTDELASDLLRSRRILLSSF